MMAYLKAKGVKMRNLDDDQREIMDRDLSDGEGEDESSEPKAKGGKKSKGADEYDDEDDEDDESFKDAGSAKSDDGEDEEEGEGE